MSVIMTQCRWYWGALAWDEAGKMLSNLADGSFLVRDSSDDRYILSLSFRSQGMTHHTRIEHYKGIFSFFSQPKSHAASNIVEFIERAICMSRGCKYLYLLKPRAPGLSPVPVQLLYPVLRPYRIDLLQHLARAAITRSIRRRELVDFLPITPKLKSFIKEAQW